MYVANPPWDRQRSPEACYCGCRVALGSWEGFVRRTRDGAYGTHPAVEANTAHYLTESEYCMFFRTLWVYFTHTERFKALLNLLFGHLLS